MTMIGANSRYPTTDPTISRAIGTLLARVGRLIHRWVAAELARRERQAARVALSALDERELKDIGICRSEIGDAVSAAAGIRRRMQRL